MSRKRFSRRTRLAVIRLEDRTVPAVFNTPWADPTHLTLSFAPDGTPALSAASSLFSALDAQMPRASWQQAILRAAQTWAEAAGVNIGLTTDAGQVFGTNGPAQGDSRFGDIRIGGLPMANELAEAIPPDASLAGTLAGDIYFNSGATFTPESLYGVALHEMGHALGVGSSEDPASVMFDTFNHNLALSVSDLAAIHALYGVRAPDSNEGSIGNNTIKDATRIKFDSSFDGSTPLVVFGDVSTPTDVDDFYLPNLDTYSGPVSVRLQTTGISLLAPKLSITDAKGTVLAAAEGSGVAGDTLTLTLPQVAAGAKYYLRVEAAPGATFAVGRYGLAVTFDDLLRPSAISVDAVLRGPYDSVSTKDLVSVFKSPSTTAFNDDLGKNDRIGAATQLTTAVGFAPNTHFRTTASISTAADVDFYHVKAPSTQNNAKVVLTTTVRAVDPNGAVQRVELYDARQVRIPATILANGNGTFTVQAADLPANTDYYVRVGGGLPGNYQLDIVFGSKASEVRTFSTGTVPTTGSLTSTLYIAQTQVFGYTLSATGPAGTAIEMSITDAAGQVIFTLNGLAGDTVSGVTGFLAPGAYQVRIRTIDATSPIGFVIGGNGFTDPIGPQLTDSASAPIYQDPQNRGGFLYPTGTSTIDPYLWLFWMVA